MYHCSLNGKHGWCCMSNNDCLQVCSYPTDIVENAPPEWTISKSDNVLMICELFFEYISNVFLKWLNENNIQRKVILFIDGLTSHLPLYTSEFCSKNGIILVAFLPNATHLLQPMDVAVSHTLKSGWKEM